ncbi:MAG: glycosyltransferase family 61 protein [Chlamydiota bacterium]
MRTWILFLILCLPSFFFAEIIHSNGPFYECENVYFNPHKEALAFLKDQDNVARNSLWKPITMHRFSQKQRVLSKSIKYWDGTTLLLVDSCSGFLTHYFHFLEHLLGVWQFGGSQDALNVKRIIFCSKEDVKETFPWKGVNQINEKLIKSLFPNAQVFTLADVKSQLKQSLHCDKMLISSRFTAYENKACGALNKMLGASWQDITPTTMEHLRQTILSSLQVPLAAETKQPRITYITRHPPRTLSPALENTLITAIENKVGVKVFKADFAKMPFEEQIRIVANTDILIGVHGNGLSHIIFLPPSAMAFELFPPTGFTWDYALLAKMRDMDYYGHVAGDWVTKIEDPHRSRFVCHGNLNQPVDALDIEAIVEIIQNR